MNNTETKLLSAPPSEPLSDPPPEALEAEAVVAQMLHDFKNQLGGVKLYAAVLKKSLANNTLDITEGLVICDKIIQLIDDVTIRSKEVARNIKPSVHQL